jgi:hypothetical protein
LECEWQKKITVFELAICTITMNLSSKYSPQVANTAHKKKCRQSSYIQLGLSLIRPVLAIALLFSSVPAFAQYYDRLPQESPEQFIARCAPHSAKPTGISVKDGENCDWIFYHLTLFADTANTYGAAISTFQGWQSSDHWHYRLAFVDTIGKSNSCWAPITAAAPLWLNVDSDPAKEMCLPLFFSPYCDAYMPFVSCIFYDDFCATDIRRGAVRLSLLDFRIDQLPTPSGEELEAIIISTMRKKGFPCD